MKVLGVTDDTYVSKPKEAKEAKTLSKGFSRLPYYLYDGIYYAKFLGLEEQDFILYLLLMFCIKPNARTFAGAKAAKKYLGMTSEQYSKSMGRLKQIRLVRPCKRAVIPLNIHKAKEMKVYMPGFRLEWTRCYLGTYELTGENLKKRKVSYAMMPNILKGRNMFRLTGEQIQVLIQLYHNLAMGEFGGVDPSILYAEAEGERFHINSVLTEMLVVDTDRYMELLGVIVKAGFFKAYKAAVVEKDGQYTYLADVDKNSESAVRSRYPKKQIQFVWILRPKYKIDNKDYRKFNIKKWHRSSRIRKAAKAGKARGGNKENA